MYQIILQGMKPECIDGFPEGTERSCTGAIHLLPHIPKRVTDAEYKHIREKFSHLTIRAQEIPGSVKVEKQTPGVSPQTTEENSPSTDIGQPSGDPERKKRRGR